MRYVHYNNHTIVNYIYINRDGEDTDNLNVKELGLNKFVLPSTLFEHIYISIEVSCV